MSELFAELKRRNVFRVAAVYGVVSWLIVQVTGSAVPALHMPDWVDTFVLYMLLIGFPLALVLAWALEMTPEGIKLEKNVDRKSSITGETGQKINYLLIGGLAAAVIFFAVDKYVLDKQAPATGTTQATTDAAPTSSFDDKSIAVLPFANRGADEESGFFADGIHDDLLTQLAKIGGLKVISRTSVMEYKDTTKNMRQIGKELGVKNILEGGIQKSGTRVRINAQLIDSDTDQHLWAESFDRELTTENIFEIQSDIAKAITQAMQLALAPEAANAIAKAPTDNVEAYRDYLAGIKHFYDTDEFRGRITARALFESAVEKDPQFALAWAMLAHSLEDAYWFDPTKPEALQQSLDALAKADQINPDLPEIHLVRAYQHYHGYLDYEKALVELEIAEGMMPGDVRVYLTRGYVYRRWDRMEDALAAWKQALDIDPRNLNTIVDYGNALARLRRYDESRAFIDRYISEFPDVFSLRRSYAEIDASQYGDWAKLLEVNLRPDAPAFPEKDMYIAGIMLSTGDYEQGLEYVEKPGPEFVFFRTFFATKVELKGWLLLALGREEAAMAAFRNALEQTEEFGADKEGDSRILLSRAGLEAILGNKGKGIALANEAHEKVTFRNSALDYQEFLITYGQALCLANDYAGAEQAFRSVLSATNEHTLLYIVNGFPACRDKFKGSEEYALLDKDFGHLSQGVSKGP